MRGKNWKSKLVRGIVLANVKGNYNYYFQKELIILCYINQFHLLIIIA
jgi:hypothetical protein